MACGRSASAWFPSFSWRGLPALVGVLVRLPVLPGVPPSWRRAFAERVRCLVAAGRRGVLLVRAGVRDRGEVSEQFGHLDAEDAGDGERAVDGYCLAGVLYLGVVRPAQPGLPGHGGLGHAPAFPDLA